MLRTPHYVRIGFSATCGILCLLLIVFWIRSYRSEPSSFHAYRIKVSVSRGVLTSWRPYDEPRPLLEEIVLSYSGPAPKSVPIDFPVDVLGHRLFWSGWSFWIIQVPIWSLVLVSVALAGVASIRWSNRFSLRTLLIAITLVGLLLGVIIATAR
jgi:hypothetical protein